MTRRAVQVDSCYPRLAVRCTRRAWALAIPLVLACGSPAGDEAPVAHGVSGKAEPATKEPPGPQRAVTSELAPSPGADGVRAFLASSGAEAAKSVDWPTTLYAAALDALASMPQLGQEEAEEATRTAVETLAKIDFDAEAAKAERAFIESWRPRQGCAVEADDDPRPSIPAGVSKQLPVAMQEAAETLASARRFVAHCNTTSHWLILDAKGRVLSLEDPSPFGVEPSNQFVEFMKE